MKRPENMSPAVPLLSVPYISAVVAAYSSEGVWCAAGICLRFRRRLSSQSMKWSKSRFRPCLVTSFPFSTCTVKVRWNPFRPIEGSTTTMPHPSGTRHTSSREIGIRTLSSRSKMSRDTFHFRRSTRAPVPASPDSSTPSRCFAPPSRAKLPWKPTSVLPSLARKYLTASSSVWPGRLKTPVRTWIRCVPSSCLRRVMEYWRGPISTTDPSTAVSKPLTMFCTSRGISSPSPAHMARTSSPTGFPASAALKMRCGVPSMCFSPRGLPSSRPRPTLITLGSGRGSPFGVRGRGSQSNRWGRRRPVNAWPVLAWK